MKITNYVLAAGLAVFALTGCKKDETVKLSAVVPSAGQSQATAGLTSRSNASGNLEISDGTNTLTISSAEVVLERIRFKDVSESGDDDGEYFTVGPQIVALPLDGSLQTVIVADVPAGTYRRVEFKIHKLSDDDDAALLATRPEFKDASIRVAGTFNGVDFVFLGKETEVQKVSLMPPLVVGEGQSAANATLSIDILSWFAVDGALLDPSSAGGEVAKQILDNIRDSFRGFRDNDRDGKENDDDDDAFDDHGVDGADHDVGDDHGVDGADHDVGDDHGVDGAAGDATDDNGGDAPGSGADDVLPDDNGGSSGGGSGSDDAPGHA